MLNGGFMSGDAVLISGPAGTGKTNLALQFLYNGATMFQENGMYISFEEMPDQIYRDAMSIGMDLRKLEAENKIRLVCTSPDLLDESDSLFKYVFEELHPKRVAMDSLTLYSLFKKSDTRAEIYKLVRFFKGKGLTLLLIHESEAKLGKAPSARERSFAFLVDSIIELRYLEIESTIRRALAVIKLRGSDHNKELREFRITSKGIEIDASFRTWEGLFTGAPTRTLSGGLPQPSTSIGIA